VLAEERITRASPASAKTKNPRQSEKSDRKSRWPLLKESGFAEGESKEAESARALD